MGVLDPIRGMFTGSGKGAWGAEFIAAQKQLSTDPDAIVPTLQRLTATARGVNPWRTASVAEALSVPAIQGAVALIAGVTGMLSMQGFKNGAVMPTAPRLITRPDPRQVPYTFHAQTAAQMAKYGEFVWWIASRDSAGLPAALVVVPLLELRVDDNPNDRLLPRYRWGSKEGTPYSPANPQGAFVHVKYPLGEPLELRGRGPLQLCGAATSVAVESQTWAANFYGGGSSAAPIIKHASELSPVRLDPDTWLQDDEDGLNEAERLKAQWVESPNNVPRVIDQNIESITYPEVNPQGAQMLDARNWNVGDAARQFRIPGPLLEFSMAGSSLTYQNRSELMRYFVETCLQPLYLEPIEQSMSDLLSRSTVARYNVKGIMRADDKTRYQIHKIAIDAGIYDAEYAQSAEGIIPGDVEFAPVPFAPPAVVPTSVGSSLSMRDVRCPSCQRLVVRASGSVEGWCRHCKVAVAA